ncbi:MAG: dockerin type I repeat-containing protein [Oscillospiraceae bacterium]
MNYRKITAAFMSLALTGSVLSTPELISSDRNVQKVDALTLIGLITEVSPESAVLYPGQEIKIDLKFDSSAVPNVYYSSNDDTVAEVDSNGIIKATGKGSTEIVISPSYGESRSVSITVLENPDQEDEFSWLPYNVDDYFRFQDEYGSVALLNGYIILSEDPCIDGGYSITESHEGTAEYSIAKEYNVRTGEVLDPGDSAYPVKVYKPETAGLLKMSWKKERTWSTEPAIWEAVKYYSVAEDLSVTEITEEEYKKASEGEQTSEKYPSDFEEYKAVLKNNPDMYCIYGETVYFLNSSVQSAEQCLIVNTNSPFDVKHDTYGYVFKPEDNSKYVITSWEMREIITEEDVVHEHKYIPCFTNYTVSVKNGVISVSKEGEFTGEPLLSYWDNQPYMDLIENSLIAFAGGRINEKYYFRYLCSENRSIIAFMLKTRYTSEEDDDIIILEGDDMVKSFKHISAGWTDGDLSTPTPDMMNSYEISPYDSDDGNPVEDREVIIKDTSDNTYYSFVLKSGEIDPSSLKVTDNPVKGDCNFDGIISVSDVIAMKKWILGTGDVQVIDNADMNDDGCVNIIDFCLLKNVFLEYDLQDS